MSILDVGAPVRRPAPVVPVVVYGNRWCGLTQMLTRSMRRAGVDFEYVDLDAHPEVERRMRLSLGPRLRTPLVHVGGDWYMAPSPGELHRALARHAAW